MRNLNYLYRMHWIRSTSGKIVILLALVFAFSTYEKMEEAFNGNKTCTCAYDGFGYYMYLPQFFQNGNLDLQKDWAQKLQNEYCYGAPVYQLEEHQPGKNLDIYHMGLAFLQLPSYTVADTVARISGYETNGFTAPYHYAYLLNAWLFIFLGLLYLRKLLLLFANETITSIVLVAIALGTNAYFIFNHQYDLPHLYLFFLNGAAFYHLIKFLRTDKNRSIYFAALLFGLTVCIRPTQLLFGMIPLFLLFQKYGNTRTFWRHILLFPAAAILWNIPQLLYWKIMGGEWVILNMHTEDMVLSDPNLSNFLFSYRKGWFVYTPMFLILPIGFYWMYFKDKALFWAMLLFSFGYIYVMSSWECWWYAASFGSRVMVDIYPILAVVLVFAIQGVQSKLWMRWVLGIFATLCLCLNLFQSRQMELGILDGYRMTKEHYWLSFGTLDPSSVHHRYLLADNSNLNWPQMLAADPNHPFTIKERSKKMISGLVVSEPKNHVSIGKIPLYETFETSETMLEVYLRFRTSDSTQSSLLRMECVSTHNCYSWNNIEISYGRPQNVWINDTLRFNLPDIRHAQDSMQTYIWNDGNATIELEQFTIHSTSLIRK